MAVVSWLLNSYFDTFSVNKKIDGVVTFININNIYQYILSCDTLLESLELLLLYIQNEDVATI